MKLNFFSIVLVSLVLFQNMILAREGFLNPEQISALSHELVDATQSVLRVATLTDTATPFNAMNLEESEQYLKKNCSANTQSLLETYNCEFIQDCFENGGYDSKSLSFIATRENPEQVCYRYYDGGGSINVVARQSNEVYLLTAWHVIQSYHRVSLEFLGPALKSWPKEQRLKALKNMRMSFDVFDKDASLLMNISPEDILAIEFIGDLKGPSVHAGTEVEILGNVFEDLVLLRVRDNGLLGKPLKIAKSIPQTHEQVYSVGFPVRTNNRSINSDGVSQMISVGGLRGVKEFNEELISNQSQKSNFVMPSGDERYDLPKDRTLIFSEADLVSGNSGGAFLNSAGELFGIAVSSFSTPERYSFRGGVGVSVEQILADLISEELVSL